MTAVLEQPAAIVDPLAIEVNDEIHASIGDTTFTTRTLPWLKIGPQIDAPVTAAEAVRLGGLDFDVDLAPLSYQRGDRRVNIPTRRAVVRSDTEEFFAVVSDEYQPVQYDQAFEFLNEINPLVSSAGALSGGRKGFMVVQVPDRLQLDLEIDGVNDPHDLYVIVQTSHDLSKAVEIAVMPLRTKCMNMLGLPVLARDAQQRWSIKHIGDVQRKLDEARKMLIRTHKYADTFAAMTRQLASVRVDDDTLNIVLKMVLPDRPRRNEQISAISHAFHTSDFVREGGGRNGWDLVNATSEYFQWGRNTSTRTTQSMFTSGINGDTYRAVSRTTKLLLARA